MRYGGGVTPQPIVLAHRGAWSTDAPKLAQNSLSAIDAAFAMGADGVELDVRRTADGGVVLAHDPLVADFHRQGNAGFSSAISELRAKDLPHLARLADVLELAARWSSSTTGARTVNIELKDLPGEPGWDEAETLSRLVASVVGTHERAARRHTSPANSSPTLVVSSFSTAALAAFHAVQPETPTGVLIEGSADAFTAAETAAKAGHQALHPAERAITPALVEHAHSLGLRIAAWTVDDTERAQHLAAIGVDCLITNYPRAVLAAIGALGRVSRSS